MGVVAESRFWSERGDYHDMAITYERNIEVVHPPYVTGAHEGCIMTNWCSWCATAVTYYEHRP